MEPPSCDFIATGIEHDRVKRKIGERGPLFGGLLWSRLPEAKSRQQRTAQRYPPVSTNICPHVSQSTAPRLLRRADQPHSTSF
jgi:hypothetical protein